MLSENRNPHSENTVSRRYQGADSFVHDLMQIDFETHCDQRHKEHNQCNGDQRFKRSRYGGGNLFRHFDCDLASFAKAQDLHGKDGDQHGHKQTVSPQVVHGGVQIPNLQSFGG